MALWVCRRCSTRFAVGLRRCPNCTSEDAYEEGFDLMPKTTRQGPSDKITGKGHGWDGSSSSTSTGKPPKKSAPNKASAPKPAPTTEHHSAKDQPAGSTAPSTAGRNPDG